MRLSHWANLKASGIFEQLAPILVDQLFERLMRDLEKESFFLFCISSKIHVYSVKKNLDGGDNLRGGETILTQVDQRVQHPEHDRDDPDDDDDG